MVKRVFHFNWTQIKWKVLTKSSRGAILDSSQESESVTSNRDPILDSSQENESVTSNRDPILDASQETVHSNVTQITMEDTVTFTEETDEDYPPLSQNIHHPQYIKKPDDSSDLELKWEDLEKGDKLQRLIL